MLLQLPRRGSVLLRISQDQTQLGLGPQDEHISSLPERPQALEVVIEWPTVTPSPTSQIPSSVSQCCIQRSQVAVRHPQVVYALVLIGMLLRLGTSL